MGSPQIVYVYSIYRTQQYILHGIRPAVFDIIVHNSTCPSNLRVHNFRLRLFLFQGNTDEHLCSARNASLNPILRSIQIWRPLRPCAQRQQYIKKINDTTRSREPYQKPKAQSNLLRRFLLQCCCRLPQCCLRTGRRSPCIVQGTPPASVARVVIGTYFCSVCIIDAVTYYSNPCFLQALNPHSESTPIQRSAIGHCCLYCCSYCWYCWYCSNWSYCSYSSYGSYCSYAADTADTADAAEFARRRTGVRYEKENRAFRSSAHFDTKKRNYNTVGTVKTTSFDFWIVRDVAPPQ